MIDLSEKISRLSNASLTLYNEVGETYPAGEVTTLIHNNKGLILRWSASKPFTNALPFTHAMVHTGKKIWRVITIKPIDNGVIGTEIEVRV